MRLILAAALAAAELPLRSVVIPPAAVSKPVRIECPVGQLTQIVFPERLILLKASAGTAEALGVAAEKSSPVGVVSVRPTKVATGTLELRGPSLLLTIALQGVDKGAASEIRLALGPTAPPAPSSSPTPKPAALMVHGTDQRPMPAPAPTPSLLPMPNGQAIPDLMASTATAKSQPTPTPSVAPSPLPTPPPRSSAPEPQPIVVDVDALKAAKAVSIGRREGLPGEPEMELDTAYSSEKFVWLRFFLRGEAKAHVSTVTLENGEISHYAQEPAGKDLRILVQLPKDKVSQKTRVTLKIESGGTYRFALSTGTFTDFLKGLFR